MAGISVRGSRTRLGVIYSQSARCAYHGDRFLETKSYVAKLIRLLGKLCPCQAGEGQLLALVLLHAQGWQGYLVSQRIPAKNQSHTCPAWPLPSNGMIIHLSCPATWELVHVIVGGATGSTGRRVGKKGGKIGKLLIELHFLK